MKVGRIAFGPSLVCAECGQSYANWGAHAERCPGPPPAYRLHFAPLNKATQCWCGEQHSFEDAIRLNRALRTEASA